MEPNLNPVVVFAASLIGLALVVFMAAAHWKMFAKAGRPGWASLIPIYNTYVILRIAEKPGWWLILLFIPLVNLVVWILALAGLAANFGKKDGFVVGLLLLPIVFMPILGFGAAVYKERIPDRATSAS